MSRTLLLSQRDWLDYRDSLCGIPSQRRPTKCLIDLYRERLKWLGNVPRTRHFQLAMSKDDAVCNPLLDFYQHVERELFSNLEDEWESTRYQLELGQPKNLDLDRWEEVHADLLQERGFELAPRSKLEGITVGGTYNGVRVNLGQAWDGFAVDGGQLVEADVMGDGVPRLIAIANQSETHGQPFFTPGPPYASIFQMPGPTQIAAFDTAFKFFGQAEASVFSSGAFLSIQPTIGDWRPPGESGIGLNARLFLISHGREFYWIEREFDVNSEVAVFKVSGWKQATLPALASARNYRTLLSETTDICSISPNIVVPH